MLLLGREEKAIDAREIGVDAFVPADRLEPVHCRHLAVMEEPRFVLAAYPDQFRIEIIEFGGEMGRRLRRPAAPDRAAVDDDQRKAEAAEHIGGGMGGAKDDTP